MLPKESLFDAIDKKYSAFNRQMLMDDNSSKKGKMLKVRDFSWRPAQDVWPERQ
jgi:hypothetical protein